MFSFLSKKIIINCYAKILKRIVLVPIDLHYIDKKYNGSQCFKEES